MKLRLKTDKSRWVHRIVLVGPNGEEIENMRLVDDGFLGLHGEKVINGEKHVYFTVIAKSDGLFEDDDGQEETTSS